MKKIKVIVEKEWQEALRNNTVMLTSALLPLLFVVIPLAALAST